MRLLKSFTVILVVPTLFLSGCGGGASSPEAAFEGFKSAMVKEDYKTGFTYLTPESQDTLLSVMLLPVGMMKAFGGAPPELDAILEKHGIDLEKGGENLAASVKDKGACFQDLLNVMKEQGGEEESGGPFDSDEFKEAKLTDLKIDGTTATAMAGGEPIHFAQVDGKWLIDLKKSMESQMGEMGLEAGDMPDPSDFINALDGEGDIPLDGAGNVTGDTPESPGTDGESPETPNE